MTHYGNFKFSITGRRTPKPARNFEMYSVLKKNIHHANFLHKVNLYNGEESSRPFRAFSDFTLLDIFDNVLLTNILCAP